jgi:hypothetical protein
VWVGLLLILVLAVGISLGLSGIGGFLVPPLLVAFTTMRPRDAVAAALIAFVPSGLLGAYLYSRRHTISPRLTIALCAGSLPGIAAGREISLSLAQSDLQRILAGVVAVAAIALLCFRTPSSEQAGRGPALPLVAAVGCAAAVLTVLVGVGGPLLVVPALVLLGVDASPAVGAALAAATVSSALAVAALLPDAGNLHWRVVVAVACLQLGGIVLGVLLRSRIPAARLPQVVGLSAAAAAVWLFLS